ncbi:MAG: MarR family transcriptional regulator [Clostridia bacterium]|nr:MarR family transcriptional regulator [Clostridia bacterium]
MRERFKTFTVLTAHIVRSIRRIKAEATAEFDLKSGHVSCLYYLLRHGAMTLTELCELCEEDKANLSRSVDHLEKSGYLTVELSAARRYKRHLFLTEKGKRVAKSLSDRVNEVLTEASVGVSEEDRTIMYRCLDKINDNLKKICDRYDTEQSRI